MDATRGGTRAASRLSVFVVAVVALMASVALAGCGGATRQVDKVVSMSPEQMCTHRLTTDGALDTTADDECFGADVVDHDDHIEVGDCVELRRAGSTNEVLSAHFTECPTSS